MRTLVWSAATGLLALGAVIAPSAPSQAASGPGSWPCSSKDLGLGDDRVEVAPISPSDSPGGRQIKAVPDRRGHWVPVILVHGWTGRATHPNSDGTSATTGYFSPPIDLTANRLGHAGGTSSLVGELQDLPGAAVFTFDYHPYSGRWVTDSHLGPALGKVIDCLARASGERVIVVAHSMGGLLARYAANEPTSAGAKNRVGQISLVVTFGTPNTGSLTAALAAGVLDATSLTAQAASVLRQLMAACGPLTTRRMDVGSVCTAFPPAGAFYGQAGIALRAGSAQLRTLPPMPTGIAVDALAGRSTFLVDQGWFLNPWAVTPVDLGDLIVDPSSATAGATTSRSLRCAYQLSARRGIADKAGQYLGIVAANDVGRQPLAAVSGPCFHGGLSRGIELTNEALGAINDDIQGRTITDAQLLSAPVPALRGMPAGRLRDGTYAPTPYGAVHLVASGPAAPVIADVTGDGIDDAAAVITYGTGAGGGDQDVLLYTRRGGALQLIGDWKTYDVEPEAVHGSVVSLTTQDGDLKATVQSQHGGMDPVLGYTYDVVLRWDGLRLRMASAHDVGP